MGILEQILAAVQANTQALQVLASSQQPQMGNNGQLIATQPQAYAGVVQPATVPNAPQAELNAVQPTVATGITPDQLTDLIQPHVGNPAIKEALGAAMRGMGINALPETQPHQYGALYSAFQQIIQKFTSPQTPTAPTSII